MSVLIKGMEMPNPGIHDGRLTVTISGDALFYLLHEYGAHPAKEIPPHGRLIDVKDVQNEIDKVRPGRCYEDAWALTVMDSAPTIIEAEEGEG